MLSPVFSRNQIESLGRLLATTFVVALTTFADNLGPHLSGLIAPFPVFSTIIAVFTHRQQGPAAAARLLRGVVLGSMAYAAFFLIAVSLLTHFPMEWSYCLASGGALCVSAGTSFAPGILRKNRISPDEIRYNLNDEVEPAPDP
jgi:hypothetical protein